MVSMEIVLSPREDVYGLDPAKQAVTRSSLQSKSWQATYCNKPSSMPTYSCHFRSSWKHLTLSMSAISISISTTPHATLDPATLQAPAWTSHSGGALGPAPAQARQDNRHSLGQAVVTVAETAHNRPEPFRTVPGHAFHPQKSQELLPDPPTTAPCPKLPLCHCPPAFTSLFGQSPSSLSRFGAEVSASHFGLFSFWSFRAKWLGLLGV